MPGNHAENQGKWNRELERLEAIMKANMAFAHHLEFHNCSGLLMPANCHEA
jgi:hypothetical protein